MDDEMMKFEQALAELEALVAKLEKDVPLDEAVRAFEDGIKVSKICMDDLKSEKGKISILVDDLAKLTEDFKIE